MAVLAVMALAIVVGVQLAEAATVRRRRVVPRPARLAAAWFLALLGLPPRGSGGRDAREAADGRAPVPARTTIDA